MKDRNLNSEELEKPQLRIFIVVSVSPKFSSTLLCRDFSMFFTGLSVGLDKIVMRVSAADVTGFGLF